MKKITGEYIEQIQRNRYGTLDERMCLLKREYCVAVEVESLIKFVEEKLLPNVIGSNEELRKEWEEVILK